MTPLGPIRYDYHFPLRIDARQRQARRSSYPDHVAQMIRQLLLTTPGERINLPDFGGGLRRMVFAPITSELTATSELLIRQSLEKYLGQHIKVASVKLRSEPAVEEGVLEITVEYQLRETGESQLLTMQRR
ncbi:MAG: GPW/gp25 family protein [Gammaproteobacteria bacterium]